MTLYHNPRLLEEMERSISLLLLENAGYHSALQMLDLYSSLNESVRHRYLQVILENGYTSAVMTSTAKEAILVDLQTFFPSYIESSALRDGIRSKAFISYARLTMTDAWPFLPFCEKALSESNIKGNDLAFVRKYIAPLSSRIEQQCALLTIREYKTKTSDENLTNIDTIFRVFDGLSPKIQKQMVRLIMTILEYVYPDIGQEVYMTYVHSLLEKIAPHKTLINHFPGMCIDALTSIDHVTPLIFEHAFGDCNKMLKSDYLGNINGYRYGILAKNDGKIHNDYFFHSTRAPSFEEILVSRLYFKDDINTYLIARIHHKPKLVDIIACLRALNFSYITVYNIDRLYEPLAFLEVKYHCPIKEKIQRLMEKVTLQANERVFKLQEKYPGEIRYEMFQELHHYDTRDFFSDELKKIFDELILAIMPASVMERFKNEAMICETPHPLNFFDNSICISHYDPMNNIFEPQVERWNNGLSSEKLAFKIAQLKGNLAVLNEHLENDAVNHGFTVEEMGLYF